MRPRAIRVNGAVHYVSHGTPIRADGTQAFTSRCRAATITEVEQDSLRVGLMVANPTGLFFHSLADGGCQYGHPDNGPGGAPEGGTWHYMDDCDSQ